MSDGPMIGRFRVSTFVFSERRDTVYDGSRPDANPLEERTAITVPIVSLDFRVTPRFGVQASTAIPLIARTGTVPRPTGDVPFSDDVRGLGDTIVGGWYRGGSPTKWSWTLNGGLSLPTGQTRAPDSAPNWPMTVWCRCRGCNGAAVQSILSWGSPPSIPYAVGDG